MELLRSMFHHLSGVVEKAMLGPGIELADCFVTENYPRK